MSIGEYNSVARIRLFGRGWYSRILKVNNEKKKLYILRTSHLTPLFYRLLLAARWWRSGVLRNGTDSNRSEKKYTNSRIRWQRQPVWVFLRSFESGEFNRFLNFMRILTFENDIGQLRCIQIWIHFSDAIHDLIFLIFSLSRPYFCWLV